MAQLARAASLLLPAERQLRSMNTTFLAAANPGEIEIRTSMLRSGKGMSTVAAEARQDGEVLTVAHLTFGTSRPGSFTAPSVVIPAVPGPNEGDVHVNLHTPEFFNKAIEARWVGDDRLFSGVDDPTLRLWIRLAGPAVTKDCGLLVALLDAPPPPLWCSLTTPALVASASIHLQVLVDPARLPGARPWFLYESRRSHAADGHSDIQGRLWAEDGRLCGVVTQHIADFSSSLYPSK